MKLDPKTEEEASQVKAALPDYRAVRELATTALTMMAEDLDLDLRERDARDLAEAVVDAIQKAAELRGISFACEIAEQEVAANERWLLAPVRKKASTSPEHRKTLPYLEQYADGVRKVRDELIDRLARIGREWLASRPAEPVVPLTPPADAGRGAKAA